MGKRFAPILLLLAGCGGPEVRLEKIRVSELALARISSKPSSLHASVDAIFPKQWRAVEVPVTCTLRGAGYSHEIFQNRTLPRNATKATWSLAFPAPSRGWQPGRYEISCKSGSNAVAHSFDVMGAKPAQEREAQPAFSLFLTPRIYATDEPRGEGRSEGETFDAASLKYITFEVPMPTLPVSYSLSGCLVRRVRTGVVQIPNAVTQIIQTKPVTTKYVGSVGYGTPGHWLPGEYALTCDTENVDVERKTFRVVGRPNPSVEATLLGRKLPVPKAEVTAMRFTEHGGTMPPPEERQYGGVFEGAARYIATDIRIELDEPSPKPQALKLRCHYFAENGDVVGQYSITGEIPAGRKEHSMWIWWGSADGNYWRTGNYFVECDSDDFFAGSRWFRIER